MRLVAALIAMVAVFGLAMPGASAHAVVLSSTPADGDRVPTAPAQVSILFSEAVSADLGGLKVLDAKGERVDDNNSSQPEPTRLQVGLRPDLPAGTYVANYKVISADGHPVSGAVVFGVGNGAIGDVSGIKEANNPALDAASKLTQFVTYLGALLAAGLVAFLAFVHDRAPDGRGQARVVRAATVVGAVGVLGTIAVQAAQATGSNLAAVFDTATLGPVLRQGLGWQSALLLLGLALCHVAVDIRSRALGQSLAFYGALIVTSSFVWWGHATESSHPWVSIPADIVHVTAAACWYGGLVGLAWTLGSRQRAATARGEARPALEPARVTRVAVTVGGGAGPRPGDAAIDGDHEDAGDHRDPDGPRAITLTAEGEVPGSFASTVRIVSRFSTLAAISVIALTIAGSALGYTEVGSLGALTTTTYGLLLLAKVAVVAVILFIAGYNRYFLLPWLLGAEDSPADSRAADDDDPTAEDTPDSPTEAATSATGADLAVDDPDGERAGWRSLLSTVRIEALAIVVVLGLTAVLVNTTPANTVAPVTGPFQETQPFRDGKVALTITPNRPGTNSFHVDLLGPDGRPADLAQKLTLELTLPAKDVGPITRDMVKAGTGHFLLENITDLSIAGTWDVTLVARVSDFDQQRVTFKDTVT